MKQAQDKRNSEIHSTTGKDKVEQYKWLMTGNPGELTHLSKSALEIDHRYQRHAKASRVLKLARRWNWLACGVLIVAKRGGMYYVVDGQHRLMAALKRSDIDRLPCLVFESADMREEAEAFRDTNKERRPISAFEQWNAQLVARDEITLFAHELITEAGRVPGRAGSPTTVCCLYALASAAGTHRENLVRAWPVIVQICAGNPLHERVFSSIVYLECHLVEGQSVADKAWREKLVRLGYQGILDASQRAASFFARGGSRVWAEGVLQEINKGSRTRKLVMTAGSQP